MLHGIQRIPAILVFVLLTLGMNINAWAQQTPMTITYEQTISESLDTTDLTIGDGNHYDEYIFLAEAGKSYEITVKSDTFAARVNLFFGEGILQGAYVTQPGAQVQFSGTLEQPGQYTILVTSFEVAALGPYTVALSEGLLPEQPPEPPPGTEQNVGGLATFTCDTVSCPGADRVDSVLPGIGDLVGCKWNCATFENVPNRFVSITFMRPAGSCWELQSTTVTDGIC